MSFFFNDTATTEIYTLSLHDALPILLLVLLGRAEEEHDPVPHELVHEPAVPADDRHHTAHEAAQDRHRRSEEHTSELQSRQYLVCRLLLENKNLHSSYATFCLSPT